MYSINFASEAHKATPRMHMIAAHAFHLWPMHELPKHAWGRSWYKPSHPAKSSYTQIFRRVKSYPAQTHALEPAPTPIEGSVLQYPRFPLTTLNRARSVCDSGQAVPRNSRMQTLNNTLLTFASCRTYQCYRCLKTALSNHA